MKHKRLILIGLSGTLLSTTGVALAATHSNAHTHIVSKVQSKSVEPSDQNLPIAVESTPVVDPVPTTEKNSVIQSANTPDTTVSVSPLDQFNQNVATKTQGYAAYFVPSYANDITSFVDNQVRCASRGLDDTTSQDVLDAKLSYFDPLDNGTGTVTYRFFSGGCQPVFIVR